MASAGNAPTDFIVDAPPIDADSFAPFGTLIGPTEDGATFGPVDAALEFDGGIPRFYVMRLDARPPTFERITRHRRVTQCLASVGGGSWLLAVAPPGDVDDPSAEPDLMSVRGFAVPGDVAVALLRGTWHAGPFFRGPSMSFFNLELVDTNQTDHQSSDLSARFGVRCKIRELS